MKPETLRENLKGYITIELIDEIVQNQKLREEIEHDIEETSNHPKSPPDKLLFDYLTDLLEDSKK